MEKNVKNAILDYLSSDDDFVLSKNETKALLKSVYEEYLSKTVQASWEKVQLEEENKKFENDPAGKAQRLEMEDLKNKLAQANKKLEEESKKDYLTGLYNRRAIFEIFEIEFKRISRQSEKWEKIKSCVGEAQLNGHRLGVLSCAIIDIDFLKKINESHGLSAGDRVLSGISKILSESLRLSDTLGRFGGEEFIIVMPDTSAKDAAVPLQKIKEKISRLAFSDKEEFHITVSIGIAENNADDSLMDDIISRAEKALLYAKQNGRNQIVVFDPIIMSRLKEMEMERQINKIEFDLNSSSKSLANIRNTVRDIIVAVNKDFVDMAVITANELCENAVKYGENIAPNQKMKFELMVDEFKIKVVVTNGILDPVNLESLTSTIDLINSSNNPHLLYKDAIRKMLDDDNPEVSHLGLLRIASECRYKLNYQIKDNVVAVTAEHYYD